MQITKQKKAEKGIEILQIIITKTEAMKRTYTLALLMLITLSSSAQFVTLDFESSNDTAIWVQFENVDNSPDYLTVVENPDKFGINTSDSCLQFLVQETAKEWVGAYTDIEGLAFSEDDQMMYMMVNKNVISDTRLKLELGSLATPISVTVANEETDIWELLEYDFFDAIGESPSRLTFFPDFPADRTEGSICLIDNIGYDGLPSSIRKVNKKIISVYPNPASEKIYIQYRGMEKLKISNIAGQEVKSREITSGYIEVVDVSDLKPGIYFVSLDTPEGTVSQKFMKR